MIAKRIRPFLPPQPISSIPFHSYPDAHSVEADRYGLSKLNRCHRIALGLIRRLEFDDGWPEGDGLIGKSRQVRERIRGRELSAPVLTDRDFGRNRSSFWFTASIF